MGLCINQGAYLASKGGASRAVEIAQAVHDRIKGYPLPAGVPAKVVAWSDHTIRLPPLPAALVRFSRRQNSKMKTAAS